MARMTSIDRLPAEVRQVIAGMRARGRTIDEILAELRELDVESVCRSSLGRHIKLLDAARLADKPDAETVRCSLQRLEGAIAEVAELIRTILARIGLTY